MIVGIMSVKLYAPWVQSLKEKRMIVKSITSKIKNKFNVSVAEVEKQDIHKTIVIGISTVTISKVECNRTLDKIISFIESNTEAQILDSQIEIL